MLPTPLMNIFNGGAHADNGLEIQEFMIVPLGAANFAEALRAGVEVFHPLKANLKKDGLATSVGDEGGFAPRVGTIEEAIQRVIRVDRSRGLQAGADIALALDAAASEFFDKKTQTYTWDKKSRSRDELVGIYDETELEIPHRLHRGRPRRRRLGNLEIAHRQDRHSVQLVGDDLFVTNPVRLARGIEEGIANAILIKLNQIGTVTETLDTIRMATSGRLPRRSSRTARARPKTRSSPISRSLPTPGRSRPAACRAAIASPSTTNSCASGSSLVRDRSMRAKGPSRADNCGLAELEMSHCIVRHQNLHVILCWCRRSWGFGMPRGNVAACGASSAMTAR